MLLPRSFVDWNLLKPDDVLARWCAATTLTLIVLRAVIKKRLAKCLDKSKLNSDPLLPPTDTRTAGDQEADRRVSLNNSTILFPGGWLLCANSQRPRVRFQSRPCRQSCRLRHLCNSSICDCFSRLISDERRPSHNSMRRIITWF